VPGKEVAGPDLRRLGSTAWHASGSRGRRGRAEQVLGQEAKTPAARGDGRSRREEGRRWRLKKGERNARFPENAPVESPCRIFASSTATTARAGTVLVPSPSCTRGRICGSCWRQSNIAFFAF
jgi:hypothetical protein